MTIAFVVPGPLDQITGGYLFDRHVVDALRAAGRAVIVHELPPEDAAARAAASAVLRDLAADDVAVIDGLALPSFIDSLTPDAARRHKLVGFVHHPLSLETGLSPEARDYLLALEMRLLPRLGGVLCPSRITAWHVQEYGVPRERILVTPPGTRKPATMPRRNRREGPLQLLAVGTVMPRKGHLLLIEALAQLADRPWNLLCIGSLTRDAETALKLQQSIERHGLGARVMLAGEWAPERLGAAYDAADIFVLPSYHEGYGMAFAEALAHGLPIIGTTGGAIPETVPADAALLVPPGDRNALTDALRLVLDNAGLRARLAQNAAKAGAQLPDWNEAAQHWIAALDKLLAAG